MNTGNVPFSYPIHSGAIMDRDFILICRPLWKFFLHHYGGVELRRFAIEKDKSGRLYRNIFSPMLKVVFLTRGLLSSQPRFLICNHRTTVTEAKRQLKQLCPHSIPSSSYLRLWILDQSKVKVSEFVENFNQGISKNMTHSFDFPGFQVQDLRKVEVSKSCVSEHWVFLDELIFNEVHLLQNQDLVLFVEYRKSEGRWIFNSVDSNIYKFSKSLAQFKAQGQKATAVVKDE